MNRMGDQKWRGRGCPHQWPYPGLSCDAECGRPRSSLDALSSLIGWGPLALGLFRSELEKPLSAGSRSLGCGWTFDIRRRLGGSGPRGGDGPGRRDRPPGLGRCRPGREKVGRLGDHERRWSRRQSDGRRRRLERGSRGRCVRQRRRDRQLRRLERRRRRHRRQGGGPRAIWSKQTKRKMR